MGIFNEIFCRHKWKTMSKKASKKVQLLEKKLIDNKRKMRILHNQNNNLMDSINLSSNYEEKIEWVREGKRKKNKLIGRTYWMEDFKDETTGEVITIERSAICRIDGKPCDEFGNLFHYYEI